MKVLLPTRARPDAPTTSPRSPAGAPRAARVVSTYPAFAAGIAVVAIAGLLLALVTGERQLGSGPLAFFVALCAPLALAASVAARRWAPARQARWVQRGALAVVLLAGAVLRFWGIGFSLPYVPHPDEPAVVNIAQQMLVTGDFNPHRFVYPSLYIYLQALVYLPHLLWGFAQETYQTVGDLPPTTDTITTAPGIYLWGRALTASLATGAIALVYGSGRRLYGRRVGLVAALLLAFSPLTIADAHLITVDVPSAFFTALAFYWIVLLYRAPLAMERTFEWWPIARAGIGVGLATATKYNAALILLPLFFVPLLRGARAPWRVWAGGTLAAGAAFLAVTPFAIPELPLFLDDVASVITHYKFIGHGNFTGDQNWLYYAQHLWRSGRWLFALALGGLLVMAFRHRRADLLVLPFPLLYYAALSGLIVNFPRNLIPLDSFLALAGAVGLLAVADGLWRLVTRLAARPASWPAPQRAVAVMALALVVLPVTLAGPASSAGRLDHIRATTDNRVAAQRWMRRNLSLGVYWYVQTVPQQWHTDRNIITDDDLGSLSQRPLDWYPAHGVGYLLLDRARVNRFLGDPARYPVEAAWYREALDRLPTVREWTEGVGPRMVLLRTELGSASMQERRDARFGADEIALHGYNLGPTEPGQGTYFPGDAAPRPFRPGETVGLTLLWQALRPPADDYQLFVHLRDAHGRTVAQRDTRPHSDTYPTADWREDGFILTSADFDLPEALPPGRYTIVLGLYPPGQPRLPARPAPDAAPLPDDELPLATIEVVR